MIGVMSMGQFALGGICVWLLLQPVFGMDSKAGALIEMSFAGGHGTLAGLTPVLQQHGVGDLLHIGLGLATIGMVSGIVVGTMLVNYAIKSPSISVARQTPTSPDEELDIDHHLPRPDDPPLDEWKGMTQVTAAAVFLGVTIAVAIALLELFRGAFNLAGSGFFDTFPLFPFTFPAAVLVQLCASRYDFAWAVNRRAVEGLGGIAMDGVIICAIGTLSLAPLGANIGPLIVLAIAAVGWSVFATLVIGRRIFRRHWFEHSIAEFGESQGMLATGFVMVDMVDPARQTDVIRGFSYRQIITRPILGGGFMTALAVPLIAAVGLPAFTIATAAITVALIGWGLGHKAGIERTYLRAVPHELVGSPVGRRVGGLEQGPAPRPIPCPRNSASPIVAVSRIPARTIPCAAAQDPWRRLRARAGLAATPLAPTEPPVHARMRPCGPTARGCRGA
jgi:glutamate:Na+ symporter, ESS family